jgi:hypothetical protein
MNKKIEEVSMTPFKKKFRESEISIEEMNDILGIDCEIQRIEKGLYELSFGNKFIYDDPLLKRIYVYLISNCRFLNEYCESSNLFVSTIVEILPVFESISNLCKLDKDSDEFKKEYKSIVLNHCHWSEEDLKETFEMDLGIFNYKVKEVSQ